MKIQPISIARSGVRAFTPRPISSPSLPSTALYQTYPFGPDFKAGGKWLRILRGVAR